mgnify:CR=1 FL=1
MTPSAAASPATRIAFAHPATPGLVSVIIPTFNRAGFIAETLDSVLAQTYPDVEIIVADDGSDDGTDVVVAPYLARHRDRIRYVAQVNAGLPAARNLGLRHARGEFVALLDSDDTFEPWKLAAQVAFLRRHPAVGVVCTDMSTMSIDGAPRAPRFLRTMYHAYHYVDVERALRPAGTLGLLAPEVPPAFADAPCWAGDMFPSMFVGNLMHPSTEMFRRVVFEHVGGFDPAYNRESEDYELSFRVAAAYEAALLDAPSMHYRIGQGDQLTRDVTSIARGNLRIVEHWHSIARDRIALPPRVVRRRRAHAFAWVGRELFAAGRNTEARGYLARSLVIHPGQPGTAARWLATLPPSALVDGTRAFKRALHAVRAAAATA